MEWYRYMDIYMKDNVPRLSLCIYIQQLLLWTKSLVRDSLVGYSFQVEDHSRNSVSYLKGLRILALESLEALKMYYMIGASVPSLHRESTDSLIHSTIIVMDKEPGT